MIPERLEKQMAFIIEIGKLKHVLRRTIVHELGHAILAGASPPEGSEETYDPYQHCIYSGECIMSERTSGWELHPFGSTDALNGCEHSPGGIYDIRDKIHSGPH